MIKATTRCKSSSDISAKEIPLKKNADESMIFIFDKIESQYYSTSNVEEFTDDYTFEDINININIPTAAMGETTLTGNININTALKALEDINLYGEVKNTNDSLIFSEYGDIIIESQNVNLNTIRDVLEFYGLRNDQ